MINEDPYNGKYCMNCLHYKNRTSGSVCTHHAATTTNYSPVFGPSTYYKTCKNMREMGGPCGYRGNYYEDNRQQRGQGDGIPNLYGTKK